MQPTVIIPTFWTRGGRGASRSCQFDHPTPISGDGTLGACLQSLEGVEGLDRVIVLVAGTHPSVEHAAEDRVREIAGDFPGLDILVCGPAEIGSLHRRMEQLEFSDVIGGVSMNCYGGVRNAGLLIGAILGADSIVFLDDDQIVTEASFLRQGMHGLGERDAQGRPILAKTGYYVDAAGSYLLHNDSHWYDTFWRQKELYNRAMTAVLKAPGLKPSSLAFGGCMALHRDMYVNVSFDPWATRGEDIDYVINARMHGGDMYLDTDWAVVHQPPQVPSAAARFRQDVFRFVYTHRKLEFSKSQVDLRQVTAESLMPYPGHLVDASITWRARLTALLRALGAGERGAYAAIARSAVAEAQRSARQDCERYFAFQRRWPILMERLWEDVALKSLFTGERQVDRSTLTGRFPIVRGD